MSEPVVKLHERAEGVITSILGQKRYGFLNVLGMQKDIFFHASSVKDPGGFEALEKGDKVSFVVTEGERGLRATGVEKIR